MNRSRIFRITLAILLLAVLIPAQRVHAATRAAKQNTAGSEASLVSSAQNAAEVELLQEAYRLLEFAAHDYHGHRGGAMGQIEAAAKLLGADVKGQARMRGHVREYQAVSDARLRQAGTLLQQARGLAGAGNQTKTSQHIDNALKQLTTALAVR